MKIESRISAYIDENFGNKTHFLILLNRLIRVETVWLLKNNPQGRFGGGGLGY